MTMTMSAKLTQIFTKGYDILPPREFIGATFLSRVEGRENHMEIVDIHDENRGRDATAVIRNTRTGTLNDTRFPGHAVFMDAAWDDEAIDARINDALDQIAANEEIAARRIVEARNAREAERAVAVLDLRAFVQPQDLEDGHAWEILMALDVLFEDIRANDPRATSFVAGQIERARGLNGAIALSIRQADWLIDVARRCVVRHQGLQPA